MSKNINRFQIEQGWIYGDQINDKYRQHPNLKPYKLLDRKEITKLEDPIREALKSIEKLDFHLEKTDTGITRIATKPLQRKKQKVRVITFLFSVSNRFLG